VVALDFAAVLGEWPLLLRGAAWTLGLTAVAAVSSLLLAVACARARVHGSPWQRLAVASYVELIRNTPFIVQLFFIYFGLPSVGVRLRPELAAATAMIVNLGAYLTEIVRAGIESTPKGQIEAARALALTERQVFLHVVLRPALSRVWPALVSQIVIVMLGSAVCGPIAAQELSYAANQIQSRNFRAVEAFIVATLIYLALSILLRQALNWIGPKWIFGRVPQGR